MREISFNPLTKIMINLEPSIGMLIEPENWTAETSKLIAKVKAVGQNVSVIYFAKNNGQTDLVCYPAMQELAQKNNVDNLITFYETDLSDLTSLKGMLKFKQIYCFENEKRKSELINIFEQNNVIICPNFNVNCSELAQTTSWLANGQLEAYLKQYHHNYVINGYVIEGQKLGKKMVIQQQILKSVIISKLNKVFI